MRKAQVIPYTCKYADDTPPLQYHLIQISIIKKLYIHFEETP